MDQDENPARIELDPRLEVCPNFNSAAYTLVRDSLVNAGTPVDQVIVTLVNAWTADNATRRELWDAQQQADRDAEEAARQLRDAAEQAKRDDDLRRAEEERAEAERKKPKMPDFRAGALAEVQPRPMISPFARHKLNKFEYIELWYFTPAGLRATAASQHSTSDDAYSLVQTDEVMAIKPLASVRASKSVVRDEDLSWRDMTIGGDTFLEEIADSHWPEPHKQALASHFYRIGRHP
ncbi:hypothetical protein B0H21DRAFT_701890, partial [Amylocystis lapponica]